MKLNWLTLSKMSKSIFSNLLMTDSKKYNFNLMSNPLKSMLLNNKFCSTLLTTKTSKTTYSQSFNQSNQSSWEIHASNVEVNKTYSFVFANPFIFAAHYAKRTTSNMLNSARKSGSKKFKFPNWSRIMTLLRDNSNLLTIWSWELVKLDWKT